MKAKAGEIILSFENAGSHLVVHDINGKNNFIIAGKNRVFKKATVKVKGKKLIVSNPEITTPVAVRYAWGNAELGTLFNSNGLPASTFRTDNWEKK